MQRSLILLILIPFGTLSGIALWQYGYWGIIAPLFQNLGAAQVFADLVIALVLVMTWIWQDARSIGRNPWPWLLATLTLGSFGPLIYLLTRKIIRTGGGNSITQAWGLDQFRADRDQSNPGCTGETDALHQHCYPRHLHQGHQGDISAIIRSHEVLF